MEEQESSNSQAKHGGARLRARTGTSLFLYYSWQNLLRTLRVVIDAKGDGHFMADCYLNRAIKGAKGQD